MAKGSYLGAIASRARADAPALAPPRRFPAPRNAERIAVASEIRRPAPPGAITPPEAEMQASPRTPHHAVPIESPRTGVTEDPIPMPRPSAPDAGVMVGESGAAPPLPAPALRVPVPKLHGAPPDGEHSGTGAAPPEAARPAAKQPPTPPKVLGPASRQEPRPPVAADPMAAVGAALHTAMQWVAQPAPEAHGPRPSPPSPAARPSLPTAPPEPQAEPLRASQTPDAPPRDRAEVLARPPGEPLPRPALPKAASARSIHIGTIEVHVEPPLPPAAAPSPIRREERRPAPGTTSAAPASLSRGFTSTIGLRQG